ncbi:MAG: hypothetical protein H0T47_22495 [Planctomycetaceae bacterium]|nr:hypothetical protein [Planctomycetaceae bacterium]
MRAVVGGDLSVVNLQSDDLANSYQAINAIEAAGGQVMHIFGPGLLIARVPARAQAALKKRSEVRPLRADGIALASEPTSEAEQLGLEAWNLRQSDQFADAKAERPRDGERWDLQEDSVSPDGAGMRHVGGEDVLGALERAVEDTSPYLIGSVAVGLILVEGPSAALQFSDVERTKVVAEVQEGLTWLGSREPAASVTWSYDIQTVRVNVTPDPTLTGYEPLESLWRNPAMGKLGFSQSFQGVRDYVASIRTSLGTRWGYVAFFTKYPLHHFAYASKPRLVMHYNNDGWGPDNIDRVFTHETGHIFGCPDEYASSGCSCSSRYGYLQEVNGNCENCATDFTPCLMAANTWAMCRYTSVHLGWRDSDGDGTLDPVDPLENPAIDLRRLSRRFPAVTSLLRAQGFDLALDEPPNWYESVPLFFLRRVLSTEELARVVAAIRDEDAQYADAIAHKLETLARSIREVGEPHASGRVGRRR